MFFLIMALASVSLFSGHVDKDLSIRSSFHEHEMHLTDNEDDGWRCLGVISRGEDNGLFAYCRREKEGVKPIQRFRCGICNFDLCDLCVRTKTKAFRHPWHSHDLNIYYVFNGWICDGVSRTGGCKAGVTGYNQTGSMLRFRCDECDYDLCECCLRAGGIELGRHDFDLFDDIGMSIDVMVLNDGGGVEGDGLGLEYPKDGSLVLNEDGRTSKGEDGEGRVSPSEGIKCFICCDLDINCSLVHLEEEIAHCCCCETCAKKLLEASDPCPICRLSIDMVTKLVNIK